MPNIRPTRPEEMLPATREDLKRTHSLPQIPQPAPPSYGQPFKTEEQRARRIRRHRPREQAIIKP
jgi:hypothetical protein